MKTLKLLSLLVLIALIFSSCGNKKAQSDESASESFDIAKYIEAAEAINPKAEDVSQYMKALELVNAKYYPALVNDPYKAHDYKTGYPLAAANLGIYSIDIVYHVYGDAIDAAYTSFAAAQELAKYVGVEGAYAAMTFDAFEGSASNRDSIVLIFNELLRDSRNYTTEEEILFVHTAFLSGVYVEKMHIVGSLIQQLLKSEELTQEESIELKELLVIYIERLKTAQVLVSAIEEQVEQLKDVIILEQFQELRKMGTSIEAEEEGILSASPAELKSNELLNASFETVNSIRTLIVAQA